jgi:hypothetical protein
MLSRDLYCSQLGSIRIVNGSIPLYKVLRVKYLKVRTLTLVECVPYSVIRVVFPYIEIRPTNDIILPF